MTTKQSIHAEFEKEFGTSSSRNIFMGHWDKYNQIIFLYDTQIRQLLEQISDPLKIYSCTCYQKIKENIKRAGY